MRLLPLSLTIGFLTSQTFAASCYANLSKDAFPNCVQLNSRYALHWNVKDGKIIFGATVDNGGNSWFALGLSENGGMKGADITVISTDSNNKLQAQDYFSEAFAMPQLDSSQDVTLDASRSSSSGNSTTAVWSRPLDTCDDHDFDILTHVDQKVIWAIGTGPTLSYHGPTNRGTTSVTFIPDPNAKPPASDPADLAMFEVYMPNVTVPSNRTTSYTCTHGELTLPKNNTKYHLIRYEGVARSKLVHHMIIYGCLTPPSQLGDIYDCESMEAACSDFTMVWAPGIGQVDLPAEAAFAGGNVPGGLRYFALQVHYNNEAAQSGVVDNSGFKMWYTEQLRPNDMGVLFTGVSNFVIPPNTDSFNLGGGECPGACTQKFGKPVTLWRNFFHMHTLGKSISTRHISNGVELEPVGNLTHYDFNFQSIASLPTGPRTLTPGDSLITTCTYTSLGRTNSTPYGESTSQEMCFNIIQYYPRVPVDWCVNVLDTNASICATQMNMTVYETNFDAGVKNGTITVGNGTDVEVFGTYVQGALKQGLMISSDVGSFKANDGVCKQTSPSGTGASSGASPGWMRVAAGGSFGGIVLTAVAGVVGLLLL
ncbi:hypothetical protein HDV00_000569 [Rhizophlyctis rosea]|nr:hypothetical protein HDV00_000569 [Rhizophlyctis rosea]